MSEDAPQFVQPGGEQPEEHQVDPAQEIPELGGAAVEAAQILVQDGGAEDIEQAHREALVEDANREARAGMSFESMWSGDTVKSLREDLQAQLDFTEAHPETVDALMTAAKADAFDTIAQKLSLFSHDESRRPETGKVSMLGARDAAQEARNQTRQNNADVWRVLEDGMSEYNRSLTFGLQEVATGRAERPYQTESTGPDRNDFEIVGSKYDGPHVRGVIESFQAEHVKTA
jgi:hypothetical protein